MKINNHKNQEKYQEFDNFEDKLRNVKQKNKKYKVTGKSVFKVQNILKNK